MEYNRQMKERELIYVNDIRASGRNVVFYTEGDEAFEERLAYTNYVIGQYGDSVNQKLVNDGDYLIIAEAGYGSNYTLRNGDIYDDRITLIMRKNGRIFIEEYYNGNMEPSKESSSPNSILSAGKYENAYTFRRYDDKHPIERLHPMTGKPFDYDPNKHVKIGNKWYNYRSNLMENTPNIAIRVFGSFLIHAGGTRDHNWSDGCFTIKEDDYIRFIRNFGVERRPGRWDYSGAWGANSMRGTVYVVR